MTSAYEYLIKAGGVEEEDAYPYTGKAGDCKFDPKKIAVRVTNFTNIPSDEEQIAAHLVHHGPLAGNFDFVRGTIVENFGFPTLELKQIVNYYISYCGICN